MDLKYGLDFKKWTVPLKEPDKFRDGMSDLEKENRILRDNVQNLLKENKELKQRMKETRDQVAKLVWITWE